MAGSPVWVAAAAMVILLGVTHPAQGQDSSSECWSAVREEDPLPPPSIKDLTNMAVFVAKFVKKIGVTEVYLCVAEGAGA